MEVKQTITNPFDTLANQLQLIQNDIADIRQIIASSTTSEKKYYSIAQCAEKLGVSAITVYRNAQKGSIPVKKVGSRLMVLGSYFEK